MSIDSNVPMESFPPIIELNVGGVFYTTSISTLTKEDDSLLGSMFSGKGKMTLVKDNKGKYFIDRDGVLFRYVLDYLRNQKLVLPENFHEKDRLKSEAEFYKLPNMVKCVQSANIIHTHHSHIKAPVPNSVSPEPDKPNGVITLGYRGTFAFGRDGLADVKFRKLSRILVCGRVSVCREVFGDTLNESRDPDRGCTDRYTCRFFLKHTFIEQAIDMLVESGFVMKGCCASGTNGAGELKPGMDSEENKWQHYNEFIFIRVS
ncbi:BTB/POZ domain-containing protein KCTD16-like [Lineus longissimus]|uniref:BTB/POZ domain-containing protein KCTD16-like n=1 Tax=Lineus longissimus TaxID=88925 RepID=UPI00315D2584